MFTAEYQDGTTISLLEGWQLAELKQLRREQEFYCRSCKEPLLLKLGGKRQWHFAHRTKSTCKAMGEAETPYHLEGKKQLYYWLKGHSLDVGIEIYLPIIQQRPDLVVRYQQRLYAVEFQCSPIPVSVIAKRSRGYQEVGITPIWLLGGNRLKRQRSSTYAIQAFEWHAFRHYPPDNLSLSYYCPEQHSFAFLQHVMPYSATRTLAELQQSPLESTQPAALFHQPKQLPARRMKWLEIKKHWRYQHPLSYPSRVESYLLQLLYRYSLPRNLFPIEAGWPSPYYYYFETSPYHWQTFLLFEFLEHQPLTKPFTLQIVSRCIQPYMLKGLFSRRQIHEEAGWLQAVKGYLSWLCQMGYLEQTGEEYFKRVRSIVIPRTMEEAFRLDAAAARRCFTMEDEAENSGDNKGINSKKANI
ncbi:hypothetical protein M3212_14095 [Alkalihalobacillus oceani]|uniref:competence protein CoiA family protein n=1 Tax=Halalkalibacter oceani TaxID=1653776 RepID=UPI00203ABE4A|nr:competence protein CoiA family protein [Halalkalibacter oceani]MCM3761903.1 hypothetical protein [Halalkalibacter oceani]